MTIDNSALHALTLYYCRHKEGRLLANEPARLLCEYLDAHLPPGLEEPFDIAIEALLGETDLDHRSDVETLGGIHVTVGRVMSFARYGRGNDFYPLTVNQLLELAKVSDGTSMDAPLPDWHDDVWASPPCELEQAITQLSFREMVKILAAHNVPLRVIDAVPTFQVNGGWFDEPQAALKKLLETCSAEKREEIVRSM